MYSKREGTKVNVGTLELQGVSFVESMSLSALFNNRIKHTTGLFVIGNGMYFAGSFNWLFTTPSFLVKCQVSRMVMQVRES
jgi:hypothetical protein